MNIRIVMTLAMTAAAVASLDACKPASQPEATSPDLGARIYSGNCVPCHQADGGGIPNVYPALAGSPVALGDPGELVRWVIMGKRPAAMPAGRYPSAMPPFGWMKDEDAAAVLSHVRSSFGNAAPAVSAAMVAQALGSR
jgi:mono/diheme cytochrome c family protein